MKSTRNDYLQHEFVTECKANSALHNHPSDRGARYIKQQAMKKKRSFALLAKLAAFSLLSIFNS